MTVAMRRRLIVLACVVAIGLLGLLVWGKWRLDRWEEQINNLELFKSYRSALVTFKEAHGAYPAELSLLPPIETWRRNAPPLGADYWRHPMYFEARGETFVLVSYGRDGLPDGVDYWNLRNVNSTYWKAITICGLWNADQVMSDLGWHRCCGK